MPIEIRRNIALRTLRTSGALDVSPVNGFSARPLLLTNEKTTWLDTNGPDHLGAVQFDVSDGDIRGPFVTAVTLERKISERDQRIIVIADADFLSNSQLGSRTWVTPILFDWLASGKARQIVPQVDPSDRRLTISAGTFRIMRLSLGLVIPGTIVLIAFFVLTRRRRS